MFIKLASDEFSKRILKSSNKSIFVINEESVTKEVTFTFCIYGIVHILYR